MLETGWDVQIAKYGKGKDTEVKVVYMNAWIETVNCVFLFVMPFLWACGFIYIHL